MKPDIKGLEKLARALRSVPRAQFDIYDWLHTKPSCGTAGCIAGWAALTFPHRFRKDKVWQDDNGNIEYDVIHRSSGLEGELGFARAFRISNEDADMLTTGSLYTKRTPKAAAKAVMALVGELKKAMKK